MGKVIHPKMNPTIVRIRITNDIRVTLFRGGRRISVWPKDGWKQYQESADSTLVTRDIVKFVKFPRLNVGKLNKRVRNLLS